MLETGNKAPEFTLQDQEGREVSLKDFRGQLLLRDFFFFSCVYYLFIQKSKR